MKCTVQEPIDKGQEMLSNFLKHAYNVGNQFERMKELKAGLRFNEVVIVIDFSENYVCKLNDEVQSAHFGASKQ